AIRAFRQYPDGPRVGNSDSPNGAAARGRGGRMRRRAFIAMVGATGAVWPALVRAAPSVTVGFMSSRSPDESAGVIAAFREGLRQMGFVDGQNVALAFRWAEGRYDLLPALAADLA